MVDERLARSLQETYLETRDQTTLAHLKAEVEAIAASLARKHMAKTGCYYSDDDMMILADACAIRFIEQYLKHEDWMCRKFAPRVMLEVKYYLYNRKAKREEPVQIDNNVQEAEHVRPEDTGHILGDIIASNKYWRNVLLDCYKAKSYKAFILGISSYSRRRWIYDHAERLHLLYKYTRRQ